MLKYPGDVLTIQLKRHNGESHRPINASHQHRPYEAQIKTRM